MTIRKKLIRYMSNMFNDHYVEYLLQNKTNEELIDFLDLTSEKLDDYFQ